MAEELGTAVLRITVDDSELRAQLRKAETLTRQTSQRLQSSASGGSFGQLDLAYKNALKTSEQLLQTDLKRLQVARQFTQALSRAQATRTASETSGFASFSQGIGGSAVDRSIRRNAEKRAQAEERRTAQLDALDADLARIRGQRNAAERRRLAALGIDAGALAGPTGGPRPGARGRLGSRVGGALSSGIIGGGFPLLFGQGAGAAVGGAAGGVAGGALGGGFGFALSVVGTAIGVAFDEALKKGETLAQGLQDPIGQFDKLREAALLSSRAVENQAAALIASGREAEAAAEIRLDLARKFGDTSDFDDLTKARDELARAFTTLGIVMGEVVAGPLTDFLARLAAIFSVAPQRKVLEARFEELNVTPEQRKAVLQQATSRVQKQFPGLTASQAANLQTGEAQIILDEQFGKTQKLLAAEADLAASVERRNALQEIGLKSIDAQAAGDQRRLLLLQKQAVELRKADELFVAGDAAPAKIDDINQRALEDTRKITQDILALDRDRFAAAQQQVGQFGISSNALDRQLQVAQKLANISIAGGNTILRDNAAFVEGILENIAASVDRQQEIENRIRAAQIRGGERAEREIFDLTLDQQTAAKQTELAIINGARELRDAGVQLRKDAQDTARSLQGLREDNLQFQTPQEQARTLAELRRQVQAEATRRGVDVRFQGTPEEQRRQMRGFVNFGEEERRLVQQGEQISLALRTVTQPLLDSNTTLGGNLTELSGAVSSLVQKDWNIVVNVQGGSGFDVEGASRGLS